MNRRRRIQVASDSDDDSDSDNSIATPKATARKRGRPPGTTKQNKQTLQNTAVRDDSPQPSTSRGIEESQGSESGSESPDSDCPNLRGEDERTFAKKKKKVKRGRPPKTSNVNQVSKNTSQVSKNGSQKKVQNNSKLGMSQCNGVSHDAALVTSLAQKCVYFLLIEDQKKYAIRKKAIQQVVFKDEEYSPKLYLAVLNKANGILNQTYGLELIELETQKDCYMIVNVLKNDLGIHEYKEFTQLKQQQQGLLLYLLTVIYMNDNVISEDELTKALKAVDIDLTSKRMHPIFGDVKRYITVELVRQMYLNYENVSKDPPKYEFTWGLRAKQEVSKRDLLQFACQIMDDTSPEDWKTQFKDAETIDTPNGDA